MNMLYWLDLEMESNEGEYKTFEILYQIVECSQTFWVSEIHKTTKHYGQYCN